MNAWKRYFLVGLVPMLVAGLAACGGDTANNGSSANNGANNGGGKGDQFEGELVCDVHNESGRDVDFSALRDPIAKHALRNGDCPTGYRELLAKLNENDTDCDTGFRGGPNGMKSMVVSEQAQLEDTANGNFYRVVVTRKCDEREAHHLFFSLFGVRPTKSDPGANAEDWSIPDDGIEMMAFDESAGVYNYYKVSRGEFEFFGDSADFTKGEGGECSRCHTGGGPIMKELHTPWVHWEGHHDTPGAEEMVSANEDLLGDKGSGSTMESLAKKGISEWNETRLVTLQAENDVQNLLRPLFCTVELNLDNGADFADSEIRDIPEDFLFDPQVSRQSIPMDHQTYLDTLDEIGQRVPGVDGDHADTIFPYTFPERAEADNDFVEKMISASIVDEAFVKDVAMVDFTRPIFSDARCDLLQFAPTDVDLTGGSTGQTSQDGADAGDVDAGESTGGASTADAIREGFIANLEAEAPAEGTAAAELLANLKNAEDNHDEKVSTFVDACKARDKGELMLDVMKVTSAYRDLARRMPLFEFPATMPEDDLSVDPEIRLNPETCVAE